MLQPSEVLYKKPILVERGSFRPVTHVNVDMLNCATAQFVQEPLVKGKDVVVLMEITMNNLLAAERSWTRRTSCRASICWPTSATPFSFPTTPNTTASPRTSRRYTKEMIGVTLGINNLPEKSSTRSITRTWKAGFLSPSAGSSAMP